MPADHPYVYPRSRAEAIRMGETQAHEDSFHENVSCARAIEQAINAYFSDAADKLREGCAQSVLEQYGFKRVNFVLANSLKETGCKYLISDEVYQWGQKTFVPQDGKYNRYFAVRIGGALLETFIDQTRQAYTALGLFGPEHCVGKCQELDFTGKVMVMSPDTLKESCWDPRNQLWLAEGGFGCSPTAMGRAVYAACLGDGERTWWDCSDFIGELDERFLPDWAAEKLSEFQGPQEKQPETSSGGMEMK